jgi:hypothetical protein
MYGEIASTLVDQFIEKIKEGKIYELKRFLVTKMKDMYKPVEGDAMIRFGRYTTITELDANIMDYPLCAYALTPIDELPNPSDSPESFIGYFRCRLWSLSLFLSVRCYIRYSYGFLLSLPLIACRCGWYHHRSFSNLSIPQCKPCCTIYQEGYIFK